MKDQIRLEILLASHMEHYKVAKDMAMFLPLGNSRRLLIEEEANRILEKIHIIEKQNENRTRKSNRTS